MSAMARPRPTRRLLAIVAGLGVAAALAAGPVFGVDPVPGPDSPGTDRQGPPITPPGQSKQQAKAPSVPITVTGVVTATTDEDGRTTYTVSADGTTYELGAGPAWFWGADHPLGGHVGKRVEIAGDIREGSDEIDVETVDGVALREPGKPPWAGGPKVVGERHPGWKPWKATGAGGKPGKGHGRDGAPGQQRDGDDSGD